MHDSYDATAGASGVGPLKPRTVGRRAVGPSAVQRAADGVTEQLGFELAVINHLRPDGDYEVAAVSGPADAVSALLGRRVTRAEVDVELAAADRWGSLCFVPHGRLREDEVAGSWTPDLPRDDLGADDWHPDDALFAPLIDAGGTMVGLLSVDLPRDGRRPDAARRQALEGYAVVAGAALGDALERARLTEQVRLTRAVHEVSRAAVAELGASDVLAAVETPLLEGFAADSAWLWTFDEDGEGRNNLYSTSQATGVGLADIPLIRDVVPAIVEDCWTRRTVIPGSREDVLTGLLDGPEHARAQEIVEASGLGEFLMGPVGVGDRCLGFLVLNRFRPEPFTAEEQAAVLDIGHDLGGLLVNARLLAREQSVVERLTRVDEARSELISTISHELRTPLAAVGGHLELMAGHPEVRAVAEDSLAAMARGVARMSAVIEDLLLLASIDRQDAPAPTERVSLTEVVAEAVEALVVLGDRQDAALETDLPEEPLLVTGRAEDLGRVVTNLVVNALKYSEPGARVSVRLTGTADHVLMSVRDRGIGISKQDQEHLFDAFFRSNRARAGSAPGTGLGLSIVRRVVQRHGGTIAVHSRLGEGSTFEVSLPRA